MSSVNDTVVIGAVNIGISLDSLGVELGEDRPVRNYDVVRLVHGNDAMHDLLGLSLAAGQASGVAQSQPSVGYVLSETAVT